MPGSTFSITLGRMEASMYKWAPVWGGGKYSLYRLYQFGVKGMRATKHVQYHVGVDGSKHV